MLVRLFGDRCDVTGFALAGVDALECATRAELIDALEDASRDPAIAIVVVSPAMVQLAGDVLEKMGGSVQRPITIVLPGPPEKDRQQSAVVER